MRLEHYHSLAMFKNTSNTNNIFALYLRNINLALICWVSKIIVKTAIRFVLHIKSDEEEGDSKTKNTQEPRFLLRRDILSYEISLKVYHPK